MKKILLTAGILTSMSSIVNPDISFADKALEYSARTSIEVFNATGKVNAGSSVLNIRQNPSVSSSVIGKITNGTVVKITGKTKDGWYRVNYNGVTGYSSGKYIALTATQITSKGKVNAGTSNLNLRKKPDVNSTALKRIPSGTIVNIISKESDKWYYIENNGEKGYVSSEYILLVDENSSNNAPVNNSTHVGKIATVNTDSLNIRSGAGANYSIVNKVYDGNNVKILECNSNGWYKVELVTGVRGWCNSKYLKSFRNGVLESSSSNSSNINAQNQKVQSVINIAKSKIGCPYVWGAQGPNAFDCSGLTSYIYKHGANINLPRISRDQSRSGKYVSKSDLKPGDLVFFDGNYGSNINHVGIYIGNGQMIHAPKPGDVVKIVSIESNHYKKAYVTARRFV